MLSKHLLTIVFLFICLISFSSEALACACCAERGYYEISRVKPDSDSLGLLSEIKFKRAAELYMTAGEFEAIRGLDDL